MKDMYMMGTNPCNGVSITEGYVKDASYTKTNTLGYFKFNKSIKNFTPELIFIKEGYKTDTVILTRGQHSGRLYTIFLREKSDTLRMKKLEE